MFIKCTFELFTYHTVYTRDVIYLMFSLAIILNFLQSLINYRRRTENNKVNLSLLGYYFTINLKKIYNNNICSYYSSPIIDACL